MQRLSLGRPLVVTQWLFTIPRTAATISTTAARRLDSLPPPPPSPPPPPATAAATTVAAVAAAAEKRPLHVPKEVLKTQMRSCKSIRFRPGSSENPKPIEEDVYAMDEALKRLRKNPTRLYAASKLRDHPINTNVPEILILGASNSGKSTFINTLGLQNGLAYCSANPGHTKSMAAYGFGHPLKVSKENLFKGEKFPKHSVIIVDSPGYGHGSQREWGEPVQDYIRHRKMLRLAILLVPLRRGRLSKSDLYVLEMLANANVRTQVIITKLDHSLHNWSEHGVVMANGIRGHLRRLQKVNKDWKEDDRWNSDVLGAAYGMETIKKQFVHGFGLGGIRLTMIKMAGYQIGTNLMELEPERATYSGRVVPFEELQEAIATGRSIIQKHDPLAKGPRPWETKRIGTKS